MRKKVSRRDFARTSVAGAAAIAMPTGLFSETAPTKASAAPGGPAARGAAAAIARRERISMPPELAYGGMSSTGRDLMIDGTEQTASYVGGWREGTTIPGEYYVEEKHYLNDERFIADHFWLMVDHENRIPKPGDFFVFEYGRGASVIIARNRANEVKAFHNVCRHRGSRLCQHGFDGVRPTEALPDGKPAAAYLSVVQLGPSGNTPVFRCPYHAWTYDLDGKLTGFPVGMPTGFDPAQNGLHPAHVRTVEGFIYISLAHDEPPDFESFVANWRTVSKEYGTAGLKIATRLKAPTKANWKLVLENFRECYHCKPSHTKSYSAVHQLFGDGSMTAEQRARIEQELERHGHPLSQADRAYNAPPTPGQPSRDRLVEPQPAGMGGGGAGRHLVAGFLTGSLDGKALGPLLPNRKQWTHTSRSVTTGFSTAYIQAYDDHIVVVRFTPRDVMSTDAEIFWLVHPDAKEGKDYQVDRIHALWGNTYREDRWICENNHLGILSDRYNYKGAGQPYAATEGGPAGFVKWYMREIVGPAAGRPSTAG